MTPKIYLALGVVALLLVSNVFVGYKAYNFGADTVQAKWDKETAARATATAEANDKKLTEKKDRKHATQNMDRNARIRYGCQRGWVRELGRCAAYR